MTVNNASWREKLNGKEVPVLATLIAYYTDKGRVKDTNEDALVVRTATSHCGDVVMAVVCDGMGGLSCGDLASSTVVRVFYDWFDEVLPGILETGYDFPSLRAELDYEIRRQGALLEDYAATRSMQMGTTMTMLLSIGEHLIVANVGDSRVYELGKKTTLLTKDHSLAQREVDAGRLRPEDMESFPKRNVLTMSLGSRSNFAPDIRERTVVPGAAYLLCSDGFRHELSTEEIYSSVMSVKNDEKKLSKTLESLSKTAMKRGETDNITTVVVCIDPERR